MADGDSFPAENVLAAGILKLSGSDALGPNPWTRDKPTRENFNLSEADFDDGKIHKAESLARAQIVEYPWRMTSAFLLPLLAFTGLFVWQTAKVDFLQLNALSLATLALGSPPKFEWAAYFAASLILAGFAAYFQTRVHTKALKASAKTAELVKRRQAFAAAQDAWLNDQKVRTTTNFWREEIRRIAAEKGSTPTAVFSQEVAKLFAAWGWEVKLNQRAQDYGVDMFANSKDGSTVVQCKHLDTSPAPQDVRELAGSRHAFGADFGLLVSIHPPSTSRQNGFFSDKGQLEFWHLGHLLEQCLTLYKQRTGDAAPDDATRAEFLNSDGTPIAWHVEEKEAAE